MVTAPVAAALPPPGAASTQVHSLKDAAQGFAALFLKHLLGYAFKARGFLMGGAESAALYDQLSYQYAQLLASREDGGIAELIEQSLRRPYQKDFPSSPMGAGTDERA